MAAPTPVKAKKPNLSAENCILNLGIQCGFNYEEEPSVAEGVQTSAPDDGEVYLITATGTAAAEAKPYGSVGDSGKKPGSRSPECSESEMRKQFTQVGALPACHMPALAQDVQPEHDHLEGAETQSLTGDSGIDSP